MLNWNFDKKFNNPVIGVDEVGRGSWAGPVMAGTALLNYKLPIDKRLDDSKKLTPKARKEILENLTEYHIFGIGEVSNYEIDKIGILKATFKAMEMALFNLVNKCKNIEPYILLVDGTVMPDFYKKLNCEIKLVKKGDTLSPSIAAASIYAKCCRDKLMVKLDEKFKGYGFLTNMGYGSKKHREKLILSGPTHIHRMTYRPMKDLKHKNRILHLDR